RTDRCEYRAVCMRPVAVQVPVAGLYSSALASGVQQPGGLEPPTTRTSPLGSRVALCPTRAMVIEPVTLHVPVLGSYTSALAMGPQDAPLPPATRTRPSGSSVAVCLYRAVCMLPVGTHRPDPLAALTAVWDADQGVSSVNSRSAVTTGANH